MGWKREHLVGLRSSHVHYKSIAKEKKVSLILYCAILSDFMLFILNKLFKGEEVKLPERFGSLKIQGKKVEPELNEDGKITNMPVNWKKTKELWANNPEAKEKKKVIFYLNEHSSGIIYTLKWIKFGSLVPNKELLSFVTARAVKKKITELTNEGTEFDLNPYILKRFRT